MRRHFFPQLKGVVCFALLSVGHDLRRCDAVEPESPTVAQSEVALPAPPSEPQSTVIEHSSLPSVMDAIQTVLREKGYQEGQNTANDWELWIGTGEMIDLTPQARVMAFIEAQLDAKAKFATSIAGRTASAAERIFLKGAAERQTEIQALETRAKEGSAEARRLLTVIRAAGEPDAPGDAKWKKRLQNATSTLAAAELAGLIVYQAFECAAAGDDAGQVGVIMVSTPKSRQMADAMLAKAAAPAGIKKESIAAYVKGLSPDELVSTIGAKTRWNERGDLCVVAFGQAAVEGTSREEDKLATMGADGLARQSLRSVAGELTMSDQSQSLLKEKSALDDGSSVVISAESLGQRISTFADFLTLPGVSTVHSTTIASHRYGKLRIVVLEWNTRSAQAAKSLGDAMQRSAGSRGGEGVQGARPDSTTKQREASGQPAVSGEGRRSDDDDQ